MLTKVAKSDLSIPDILLIFFFTFVRRNDL